jgi:cysteine desulfurase
MRFGAARQMARADGQQRIYLDANATTSPLAPVIEAVADAMRSGPGNPASSHASGASSRRFLEVARDRVSTMLGVADPDDIIFVSGGTEANNTIISSFARSGATPTFLLAEIEHPSVTEPLRRWCPDRVTWLRVDHAGLIDPDEAHLKAEETKGPVVLMLQTANGETGVIQPIEQIVTAVRSARPDAFVHLDAAQGAGRIRLDGWVSEVDSLCFSGHKIHGPLGTGVLAIRDGTSVQPFLVGGGQERGMRSGTPNVPGLVGLGVAARIRAETFDEANDHMRRLRDRFEAAVLEGLDGRVQVNGGQSLRVSNTSNLRFRGADGMQLLANFDAAGVMASQGSACSSGRPEPSRALQAMGLSEREAFSSLRFSFSVLNTDEEAREAADIVNSVVGRIGR